MNKYIKGFLENIGFSHHKRLFFTTAVIVFVVVIFQKAGIEVGNRINFSFFKLSKNDSSATWIKPKTAETEKDKIDREISPLLEKNPHDYQLKKPISLVPTVRAGESYQEASAYAVIDFENGSVIEEKNLSKELPIASLTKIMTAVTALDLLNSDEICEVSYNASHQIPTHISLSEGEKLTFDELLHASLMTSANDATEVIKECADKKFGFNVFIKAMNLKADFLGLKNSNFSNPQGFDSATNFSTVEDLSILSHYALTNYPLIGEIIKKDQVILKENSNHKKLRLLNWNGLIGVYPNVSGIKIGNTNKAQKTTVVLSERKGKKILVVLLGAPTVLNRDLWTSSLLDIGFKKTLNLPNIKVSEEQLRNKYRSWSN